LFALTFVEGMLGVLLLLSPTAAFRWMAAGLLVAFTMFLTVLALSADPPSCGCFGLVMHFRSARTEAIIGIGRNLMLVGLLLSSGRPPPAACAFNTRC